MPTLSERLKKAVVSDSAVHAYLITGGDSENLFTLAMECAALVMFGSEETQRLAASPDFFHLDGSAGIDEFRNTRRELYKSAFGGGNRVVCIVNAHLLNDSAVNAILKMLEEPPRGTYFFLTGSERQILSTVRSRCLTVRLGSASKAEIKTALEKLNAAPAEAELYSSESCSFLSKAVKLYRDESYRELREKALNAFFDMLGGRLPFKWSKTLAKDRDGAKESVEFMLFACHDLLLLKCGLPIDANIDKRQSLTDCASRFTTAQIRCIIDALADANERLYTNASVSQSLDGLTVEITEVI